MGSYIFRHNLQITNIFLTLQVFSDSSEFLKHTYCESVFRKSFSENVVVFLIRGMARNNTHFRIDTSGRAHSSCPNIPYLSECGVLCRLFLIRSYHNLQKDKRNLLHTFFLF